jgi:hypothetical protein
MSGFYPIGQPVRLATTTTDAAGVLGDPTALVLTYGLRGGTLTTKNWPTPADITKDSTGTFHYDVPALSTAGQYIYTWTSTGTNAGERADVFSVFDPATYPRLVSFAEAKTMTLKLGGTADDDMLDRMIGWASARILADLEAVPRTVTERVAIDGSRFLLNSVPVRSVTSITPVTPYAVTVQAANTYVRSDVGGVIEIYGLGVTGYGLYDVTYSVGEDTIPPGVDGACLALIRHWWNQMMAHGSATYGDSGFVPDFKGLPNLVINMLGAASSNLSGIA